MITEILTMTIVRDPIQHHPQPHPLEAEGEAMIVEDTKTGGDIILRRRHHPPEITGAQIIAEAVADVQIIVAHQTIVARVVVHLALAIIPGHLEADHLLEEDPN